MKRLAFLALVVVTASLTAQEVPRFRSRIGHGRPQGSTAPVVLIESPTALPTLTVASSTITLAGTAASGSAAPLELVEWACATCTPTSGTAVGLHEWSTPTGGAGAGATVFSHGFTSGSNVPLTQTTPTTGTNWSEVVNNTGAPSQYYAEVRSGGYLQVSTNKADGTAPLIIARATPSPAIGGTNYDVSVKLVFISNPGTDDGAGLIFGYADSSNYCGAQWYGSGAATDLKLFKTVAGVVTSLGTANIDPAANDTIKVQVRGSSLEVFQNDVSKLTATEAFCDDSVGVGIGLGALTGVAADDLVTATRLDDFTVVDQDGAASGITLANGANTIVVTVTDAAAATGTDTIVVTREATDSVDPAVTIDTPTALSTYGTSTTAIVLEGDITDNTEPTSASLACPTCTPDSASCTLSGTGAAKRFVCGSVNLAAGANTLTVTGADAATNNSADVLTATYTAVDATAPTLTITIPTSNLTTSTSTTPLTVGGTASDAVGVTSVLCGCDVCGVGTVSGLTNWSVPVTLLPGQNIVSCTARDEAGNVSTADTLTITYSAGTLTIVTTTLPSAREDAAYAAQTLQVTGGTAPFAWDNNSGGSSLGGGACTGLSISAAGVVSGTPTTAGTCNFTAKVTDNAAATDTQALSIVVTAAGAEGPHDYFASLVARGDCTKAYSLRPLSGETAAVTTCAQSRYEKQLLSVGSGGYRKANSLTTGASTYFVTYASGPVGQLSTVADSHPQAQDAAKVSVPAFLAAKTLAQALDADDTVMFLSGSQLGAAPGRGFKIDNEIVTISALTPQAGMTGQFDFPIVRGQFGTTAAAHNSGAQTYASINSLPGNDQIRLPIATDGTVTAKYLFTWDVYATDSWLGFLDVGELKTFQLSSSQGNDSYWFEPWWSLAGCGYVAEIRPPGCVAGTHLGGAGSARFYSATGAPVSRIQPLLPVQNTFLHEANKWLRYWVLVEANEDTEAASYTNVTTLNQAMTDSTTTMVIDHSFGLYAADKPFYMTPYLAPGGTAPNTWPGRNVKIGTEIVTVVSCPTSGSPRSCTVVRGTNGTSAAAHSAGANVALSFDYVTMYLADEDTDPVLIYDRLPVSLNINRPTASQRNALDKFWLEFNTSGDRVAASRAARSFEDMVAYVRNFVWITDPPADWSSLRVKPVR